MKFAYKSDIQYPDSKRRRIKARDWCSGSPVLRSRGTEKGDKVEEYEQRKLREEKRREEIDAVYPYNPRPPFHKPKYELFEVVLSGADKTKLIYVPQCTVNDIWRNRWEVYREVRDDGGYQDIFAFMVFVVDEADTELAITGFRSNHREFENDPGWFLGSVGADRERIRYFVKWKHPVNVPRVRFRPRD